MVVCQLATFVIAGVVTTIGLIVPTAAAYYGVEVTTMASQFTWFTGAGLVGQVCAFFVFDYFSIKRVVLVSHLICAAALWAIHISTSLSVLAVCFVFFGMAISTAITGSSTLIAQLWTGRARQSAIVAQDAMFNGGGVLFAALTTWFLARSLPFSSVYLVVVGVIVVIIILALISDFEVDGAKPDPTGVPLVTEWNPRIILIGVSLLLFMLAKITIFIWAPQYVVQRFEVDASVSGQFMSNVFITALIGSLAGTWLVAHINVRYLVYGFVCISLAAAFMLTRVDTVESILLLAFVYGISVSATFNAYVALALTQVATPTHRNIAYMLLMSALGSSCAPLFSSQVVATDGRIESALTFSMLVLVVVVGTLAIMEWLAWQRSRAGLVASG